MKTILIAILTIISISVFAQDTTKVVKDYDLVTDTTRVEIPPLLFSEYNQIEQAIPKLNARKEDILKDVFIFNESKLKGYKYLGQQGDKMVFIKTDTIKHNPKKKK